MSEKRCRAMVLERSEGLCERCGRKGNTFHHRKNRSAGGGWDCSNIVFLCGDGTRGCHGWVTEHPLLAGEEGFHIPYWKDPIDVPILLHGRLSRQLSCNRPTYTSDDSQPHDIDRETDKRERIAPDDNRWNPDW